MTVSKVLQRKMFRDPSQDENVGIMQGFMDDVHEMLGVDDMFDEEPGEEDDGGVTKAMNRRPNSPEILMNTLRGDMRSVDARIEELADMVGYNAAASTPPEVLALLQPMLKQQGIAALETAAPDMPDMGMAPPPGAMGMAPPPGAMGMAPPPDAMGMAPPPGMEGGIGSLPQGDMGQPPMQMARGGPVQYFQDGSDGAGVTPYDALINEFLNRRAANVDDPMVRARELAPQYQELLGTSDKGSAKAQMMFDIAQAALGYAANVGPDGQPLRGSQASRLAGATRALPGQIAARGAQVKEGEARARLAALGQAQSEREAAIAANTALSSDQLAIAMAQQKQAGDLALEGEKQKAPTAAYRTLEARSLMLPEADRAAFIARGGVQDAAGSNLQDFFGSVDGGPPELLLFSPDRNNLGVFKSVNGELVPVTGQVTRADATDSANLQRLNASVDGNPAEILMFDPSLGKYFRNVGGNKVEVTGVVKPAIEFMRDPVTGIAFKLNPTTGLAEPITQTEPDEPNMESVFKFMNEDLNFDPSAGTGAAAAFINAWNNTVGQLPLVPVGETTSAAAQMLRNIERKAVDALKISSRPPIFEQEKIGELLPNPVAFFENPQLATNRIVDFVNVMGDQYVNDMRFARNINNRDDEARKNSLSRARAFKSIINDIITPEASIRFFEALDTFEGNPTAILEMSDEEFNNFRTTGDFSRLTPAQLDAAEARIRSR